MKLFVHAEKHGSNNCYIIGNEPSDSDVFSKPVAIVIDPGHVDQGIIDFIEENNYSLSGILITHDHKNHVRGIKTFMSIYKAKIFAVNPIVRGQKTVMIRDGDIFSIPPFRIEAFSAPGHSIDSAIYRLDRFLFTGDTLNAGLLGKTSSSYGAKNQLIALKSKIFSLPGNYIVLPGHGPPSTLNVERHSNAGIALYEQSIKRQNIFLHADFDF